MRSPSSGGNRGARGACLGQQDTVLGYLEELLSLLKVVILHALKGGIRPGTPPMKKIRSWNLKYRHGRRSRRMMECLQAHVFSGQAISVVSDS